MESRMRWPAADRWFVVRIGLAAAALLALLLQTYPLTYWEYDELLFGAGVASFDPLVHHPHPPGYPVFIGLGKVFNVAIGDPFAALVTLSITSTLVGFIALAAAGRNLLRNGWLGLGSALLFYLSAGMIVHASVALSDATAMALLTLAIHRVSRLATKYTRYDACWFGLTASLAVGCRPQLAVMVLPLMAFVALRDRSLSRTAIAWGTFAVVALCWLLPLVVATGGVSGFMRYQFGQAERFATFDAGVARNVWPWSALALRFLAHPWGLKLLSMPALGLAVVGLAGAIRRKDGALLSLVASGGLYLAFAATAMDPADAVRYTLPGTMVVALMATSGCGLILDSARGWAAARGWAHTNLWVPLAVTASVALFAVVSIRYVGPVVWQRHRVASPPVQAAAWARQHLPSNAVILFELPMHPHARQLFVPFRSVKEDSGEFQDRADVPLYVLADHESPALGTVTFSWNDSDAYRKLTRDHYRIVSLAPVPTTERYRTVRGAYTWDRLPSGERWRWLAPAAELALPDLGATRLRVGLGLPPDYPWESNAVKVAVNGRTAGEVTVRRGETTSVNLDLPQGAATITFVSARAFVPASLPGTASHDTRNLGVMLRHLEQVR